jgi:hypothetical protein
MSIIDKKITTLKEVLALPLMIPPYQRPYKWTEIHVNQLVDDILHHMRIGKSRYRLGTIVLHQENSTLNIVDGQQRLLSLSIFCHYLQVELNVNSQVDINLLKELFQPISLENLQHNAVHIKRKIDVLGIDEKSMLREFFLEKCELVCVTLNNISEAFQFFDSQNSRGKSLETYDLLKAFHLREMAHDSEDEVNRCVERWEKRATHQSASERDNLPKLSTIINDVLFPIRRWTRGEAAIEFTNADVRVFKGVNFKDHHYPHITPLRAIEHTVVSINVDLLRVWDWQAMEGYPYQSTQVLHNGKRFFDYVEHYAGLYNKLFIDEHEHLRTILTVLDSYKGRHRTGDIYVKKLFFCAVMFYYDKFGEHGFERTVLLCFQWSYRLRLVQSRVQIESINNHAISPLGLLRCISHAIYPSEVLNFLISPVEKVEATKVDKLEQFFEIKATK